MSGQDPNRGTGRTTGLMLIALGQAALARGEWVEFRDHMPHTCSSARHHCQNLRSLARHNGLFVEIRRTGAKVEIRSKLIEERDRQQKKLDKRKRAVSIIQP